MTYNKTVWNNGAAPPLSADNLNNIENGIEKIDNAFNVHLVDYTQFKGDLSTLQTQAKDSIPNIINELFLGASEVKTKVATAITGKGVPASSSDTGQQLADKIGLLGGGIKSVQHGLSSMLSVTTLNVNIGSVDPDKSIILVSILPSTSSTNTANYAMISAKIVDATTINFRLPATFSGNNPTVSWHIIEFEKLASLQKGSLDMGSSNPIDVTVAGVNLSKSVLISNHRHSYSGTSLGLVLNAMLVRSRIKNSTTIEFSCFTSGANVEWQLIEFE